MRSLVGSRSRLQDVPKIAQIVESRLHDWVDERCVEPKYQQIVLPSLWPRKKTTREGPGPGVGCAGGNSSTPGTGPGSSVGGGAGGESSGVNLGGVGAGGVGEARSRGGTTAHT